MFISILVAVFVLSLFLLIYPFVIYPLALGIIPSAKQKPMRSDRKLSYALLMCARNEAASLDQTVDRLRMLKQIWPDLEIAVYDDASTDRTQRILASARDIMTIRRGPRQVGKARGLRILLDRTQADVVLFMDANTLFDPASLPRFRDYFSDITIGAVGARLRQLGGRRTGVGRLYWALEEWIKAQETRTGSTMGCDGSLWGMRRSLYPRFDPAASDDFRPSLEPLFHGYRVITAPDIEVSENVTPAMFEMPRIRRVARGAWHAHRAIAGSVARLERLNRFKYASHKLLRWFSGLWLLLMVTALWGLMFYAGLSGPAVFVAIGAVLAARMGVSPFAGLTQMALVFVATTLGVFGAMLGRKEVLWTPAR